MKNTLIALATLVTSTLASATSSFDVEVTGSGAPIIFIPGLSCDGSVWSESVERYSPTHQCHVLSIKGFGANNKGSIDSAFLETVKADLATYIQEAGLTRPTIVGHSLGGFVALDLAQENNDLAGSLLVVDSLPFLPGAMNPSATVENMKPQAEGMRQATRQGGMSEQQARFMMKTMVTDDANIDRAVQMSLSSDPATVAQAMYELNTTDIREDLASVSNKTIVLGAWIAYQQFGSTTEMTQSVFESQFAAHPNYQLSMSDKGRHFIMWDDPDFFYSHLDNLLAH